MASLGIDLLRAAREKHRGPALHRLELGALHAHALCARAALASAAPRRRDDWSIETPLRCKCPLCVALARYLRAPDQVRLEWPLAKAQRMHVHQVIDALDLPLRHTTRRSGRPFTLMLEKTSALFERSAAAVRAAQADLHWLRKTAGQFG
jgi:hypothetical protein